MMRRVPGDDGQAVVLLLAVVAFIVVVMVAVGALGHDMVARGQAQTAADAAALAATIGGRAAAQRLVERNDATLVSYSEVGGSVMVVVQVRGVTATARASRGP